MSDATPETLAPQTVLRLATGVRVQTDRVSGKPALLDPERVLLLNPTAAAIVELCDGCRAVSDIVETLAGRYDAPPETLAKDTTAVLERLLARGLLERV